ncbi:hypothetical protein MNBD_GAMMA12-3460 [hydrothermal vent metagenome]|uniref:Regulatory protein, RpfE type n=1 Tax=hydrothermal vent metagenome TaxID=652676 RepID=A0A3B0Z0L8_9ZZZZ
MHDKKIAHIIIPGLEAYSQFYALEYSDKLAGLLNRSEKVAIDDDYYGLLSTLFESGSSLPVAGLKQKCEPGGNEYLLCADPVYMQADRSQLLMFDSHDLEISMSEAKQIIESLNTHFIEDGLEFSIINECQWTVCTSDFTRVDTTALYRVINRPLLDAMPTGEHGSQWKAYINEIQMLLYHHDVNLVRQDKGMKTVNGIWFWGGGACPEEKLNQHTHLRQVFTDEQWLLHLAKLDTIAALPNDAFGQYSVKNNNSDSGDILYIDTRLSSEYKRLSSQQFTQWILSAEKNLWSHVKPMLANNVDQINIYPGNGFCYEVTSSTVLSTLLAKIKAYMQPIIGR